MKTKPLAFLVHLLTGSGAALALMALISATREDWQGMFIWLGLALVVDGIDGPLARKIDTKTHAANWDGAVLDLVIDYLNYVFIPAYAFIYTDLLPAPLGLVCALFVALTAAVYFADVRMKARDHCFVGYPGVWQMPLLVLLVLEPPPLVTCAVVLLLGLGQFAPVKFVHPVRTLRWRPVTLAACVGWLVFAGWVVAADFEPAQIARIGLLVTSLWLLLAGALMQLGDELRHPAPAAEPDELRPGG